MQKEIDRLIEAYQSGELTREEAGTLAGWLEQSDENRNCFRKHLAVGDQPPTPAAEREWARFVARNRFLFVAPTFRISRWRRIRMYAVAAAILLVAGGSLWLRNTSTRLPEIGPGAGPGLVVQALEFRTARGEKRDILLPDSSTVCLNSEAVLTVLPGFGRATREIAFDGEGFFRIAPDAGCPFIIHSADNDYTVLGTSFNLQSYAKENFAVVTLHTGCLQAQVKKDVIILDPNEELQIDATSNTISKRAVRVDDSIGWIDGRLVFSGYPLRDVANKLSRYYQVKINIHDEIANLKYTGVVDKESLAEALRMISATSPVRLSITDIDGEYFLSRAKRR